MVVCIGMAPIDVCVGMLGPQGVVLLGHAPLLQEVCQCGGGL